MISSILGMHRKKVIAIVIVGVTIIGISLGLALHVSRILAESRAAEISKQSPVVQNYLNQHPSAKSRVTTYTLSKDGKNYHCWMVHWYDPTSIIPHIVNVYVDKDSWEIVSVGEAH